jgi:hypothetical protein
MHVWTHANGMPPEMLIGEVDKLLHAQRTNPLADGAWVRRLADLPPGVMVHWNNDIHLWSGSSLRLWASEGYEVAYLCEQAVRRHHHAS